MLFKNRVHFFGRRNHGGNLQAKKHSYVVNGPETFRPLERDQNFFGGRVIFQRNNLVTARGLGRNAL